MQSFSFGGLSTPQDPPAVYGIYTLPPVGIQVFPPPLNPGELDLLTVQSGVTVGTTPAAVATSPVVLGIPDDLAWAVVWGAVSDLLSQDGPARDPARANYCEQRYLEAVEIAKINPTVMLSQVNGQPVWTGSVFELDVYQTTWQAASGQPQNVGLAGRNLIALGPVPDAGPYGVTLDVVSHDLDPDIGRRFPAESIAVISTPGSIMLNASRCFKMAGTEWDGTEKLEQELPQSRAGRKTRACAILRRFAPTLTQPALACSPRR